ncbi:hypothetical protein [Hamadaea tsunoensis]|uniref:hypothetical protein n=1 Tax=Hamadaea tsunoensis TaxID=53368 RepID=UPI00040196FB|nr:hypothetical protein [Hamadaea tsunoensis]
MSTFSPRMLGEAENAVRALLNRTLAGSGIGYHEWVLINVTALNGGETDRARVTDLAVHALKITAADVDASLAASSAYLDTTPDTIRLTDHGRTWYADRSEAIGANARVLFADLDEHDLDATARVLTALTERANQLLAA